MERSGPGRGRLPGHGGLRPLDATRQAAYRRPTLAPIGGCADGGGWIARRRSLIGPVSRVALGLVLCLWATWAAGAGQTFEGQGRVTAVDPRRSTVTIAHGAIPGLLPATQSEFPVQGSSGIPDVRPGDRIRFTLGAADDSHGLLTIVSLAPERAAGAGWPDRSPARRRRRAGLPVARRGGDGRRPALARDPEPPAPGDRAGSRYRHAPGPRDRHAGRGRARSRARSRRPPPTFRVGYVQELRRRLARGPARRDPGRGRRQRRGDAAGALIVVQRGTRRSVSRRRARGGRPRRSP